MIKFLNCLALSSAVNSIKNENSIQILSKYYYNTLEVKVNGILFFHICM